MSLFGFGSGGLYVKLNFISQLKIQTKRKIAYKKENLEHNCILQESCKTVLPGISTSLDVGRDLLCLSMEVTAYDPIVIRTEIVAREVSTKTFYLVHKI